MSCCAAGSLPSPWWKRARPRRAEDERQLSSEAPLAGRSLRLVSGRPALGERSLGWLRYLERKVGMVDDWGRGGHPSELWDDISSRPTYSWHRFDLIQSSYALALMCDVTPAWREVYERLLDGLLRRYVKYWGCVDWMETLGDDPDRDNYPESWYGLLIPEHLRGRYNAPGWTGNGLEPWGLEWDPIGAQGNLFYKGWLDLLLGFRKYIGGGDAWNEPFVVVGEPDRSFSYTHRQVNDVLQEQWASRPEGCHCENTKIWPTCLSAAALGLRLHDQLYGTRSHWVFDQWWEHAEQHYIRFDDDGRPRSVALYYDPLIDHAQEGGPAAALPLALHLAPQRPDVAARLFEWAVRSFGWDDPERELWTGPKDPWLITTAIVLARELGNDAVYTRLRAHAEAALEPTWSESGEFHYGFGLGERIPRGQPNATLLVADAGQAGSWSRIFTEPNQTKFTQPTVTDVDYPLLGIAQAHYDPDEGSLAVATYAATPHAAGQTTTLTVGQLADPERCRVRRDDRAYERIKVVSPDRIELTSEIGEHAFLLTE